VGPAQHYDTAILAALVLVGLALVGMFVVLVGHVHAQD